MPFLHMRKATGKQLKTLGGRLSHCSMVIRGGRSFSARIFEASGKLKKPYHKFRITKDFRFEILWWLSYMSIFNGYNVILGKNVESISIYTDASNFGYGALYNND